MTGAALAPQASLMAVWPASADALPVCPQTGQSLDFLRRARTLFQYANAHHVWRKGRLGCQNIGHPSGSARRGEKISQKRKKIDAQGLTVLQTGYTRPMSHPAAGRGNL